MTECERYRKLKLELEDIAGKLVGLPQRVNALKAKSKSARDEAVRMELLGDPGGADKMGAGIRAAQDEVRKIEADQENLMHRREILLSVLEEVKKKAEPELSAMHTRAFAKAVKSLAGALRAALAAEFELAAVRGEADRAFGEIGSRLVPLPTWVPLLLRSLDSTGAMRGELVNFLEQMKGQGFDVS